jgi:hypothetical protein
MSRRVCRADVQSGPSLGGTFLKTSVEKLEKKGCKQDLAKASLTFDYLSSVCFQGGTQGNAYTDANIRGT